MDKIICDVCGTSYPENAAQCPICGCARPNHAKAAAEEGQEGGYVHMKGGRFSSDNVRKRNQERGISQEAAEAAQPIKPSRGTDMGRLIGMITILVLLVVVVVLVFFIVKALADRGNTEDPVQTTTEYQQDDSDEPVLCRKLHTDSAEVVLEQKDSKWTLNVTTVPANCTEFVHYASMDPSIASVDVYGTITAVSTGQTAVLVTCGEETLVITVKCTFDDGSGQQWGLNRKEFTLFAKGETWELYSKTSTVPKNKIKWTSDDEAVATVEYGIVTAVGPGTTQIHAEYNGTVYHCTVHCNVKSEDTDTGDDDGEDKGDDSTDPPTQEVDPDIDTSTLKISHTDATIKVKEAFVLQLKDAKGNVANVTWTVSRDGYISIKGNTITGVRSTGNDFVTIRGTYDGKTYECIVRVK